MPVKQARKTPASRKKKTPLRRRSRRGTRRIRKTTRRAVKKAGITVEYALVDGRPVRYPRLPKKWSHVGGGSFISSVGGKADMYPVDDEFSGPVETKGVMTRYLRMLFGSLLRSGQISRFRLT